MGNSKKKMKIKYRDKQYNMDTIVAGIKNIFGPTAKEKDHKLAKSRKTFISK